MTGTFLTQKLRLEGGDDDAVGGTTTTTTVKFNIWDTAGGDRYRPTAPLYYKGAAAAIVVYDVTNPSSLESAKSWIEELSERNHHHHNENPSHHNEYHENHRGDVDEDDHDGGGGGGGTADGRDRQELIVALVGNKIDLVVVVADGDQLLRTAADVLEDAEAYAADRGIPHLRTSAKTAHNVRDLFAALARRLPAEVPDSEPTPIPEDDHEAPRAAAAAAAAAARTGLCCRRCRRRTGDDDDESE